MLPTRARGVGEGERLLKAVGRGTWDVLGIEGPIWREHRSTEAEDVQGRRVSGMTPGCGGIQGGVRGDLDQDVEGNGTDGSRAALAANVGLAFPVGVLRERRHG